MVNQNATNIEKNQALSTFLDSLSTVTAKQIQDLQYKNIYKSDIGKTGFTLYLKNQQYLSMKYNPLLSTIEACLGDTTGSSGWFDASFENLEHALNCLEELMPRDISLCQWCDSLKDDIHETLSFDESTDESKKPKKSSKN